jgi:hypothetical protein
MEPDTEHTLSYPPNAAFQRLVDIFPIVAGRNGADPFVGRRVAEMFRLLQLEDVQVVANAGSLPPGDSRRTLKPDLVRSMRPHVVEMGLATEAELATLDREAREHLADPDTIVVYGLFFGVSGRKPQP